MSYKRKTRDEFQIHGDYGQGFEEVTCYDTWREAKQGVREYRENEGGVYKIIKRRVKI